MHYLKGTEKDSTTSNVEINVNKVPNSFTQRYFSICKILNIKYITNNTLRFCHLVQGVKPVHCVKPPPPPRVLPSYS